MLNFLLIYLLPNLLGFVEWLKGNDGKSPLHHRRRGLLYAERKGFEPLERKAFNGFRDRPDRPLRHLSLLPCQAGSFQYESDLRRLAETEGFEPPKPFGLTVFKTAAIDHSAISPLQKYNFFP